ncbi:AsmA-like C-terminal region-containing protein [Mesorhizobium sp. SB112]|uniref:AsmA family protein n=1 Tax=Mesorhizobium sp. SB112 TaxID=3151853 RepID=UPI0032673B80
MLARIFVIVGGLIVMALTVALIGPYFIDWTGYRAQFEREASIILGRKVTVEGDAKARILPFPSVTFTDVSVGAETGGAPSMTIEEFSMDAELAPFLRGEVLIFDMRLVRPRATIDVAEDGAVDWAVRPSTPFDPRNIQLEDLTISDGQISIRHAAGGRRHLLADINTKVSARSLAGPWRMDGTMVADGMPTAFGITTGSVDENGRMRVRIKADPEGYPLSVETDGNVGLEKGAAVYSGGFKIAAKAQAAQNAEQEKAAPGYRMNGRFALDHKLLDLPEFRFETGPLDNPYTADGKAKIDFGEAPHFSVEATGAQVRFDEAVGGEQAGTNLTLTERITALEDVLAKLPHPTIPGQVSVDLPAVVAGDTTLRDIRLSAEPTEGGWALNSLAATLPGRTALEAQGKVRTDGDFGFTGSLLLAVKQPSGFAAWVSKDVDDAIRNLPAAGFQANVEMTRRKQVFNDLELALGDAKFTGTMESRQPEEAKSSVLMKLEGGALDVEGLSAFASLFVSEKGDNRFTDSDLDFQIKAGPLSVGGFKSETVDTALRLRDGVLEIDRLALGGLEGASISATGRIRNFPKNPSGNLDASIVAVDLAPLISVLGQRYGDNPLIAGIAERNAAYAGLFEDSRLDIVASAAPNDDETTGLAVSAQGEVGGTAFSTTLSAKGKLPNIDGGPLLLTVNAKNDDMADLLALYGFPALPLGLLGPGQMDLTAKGTLVDGLETALKLSGDDFTASFDGIAKFAGQGAKVEGGVRIDAADLEPYLMTTGVSFPGIGLGMPVSLSAAADYGDGLLVLSELAGAINENAIAGDINSEMKDGLPSLSGAITVDEFDVDPLARMMLGDGSTATDAGQWSTTPFSSKPQLPFTAQLDVTAGALSAGSAATVYDARFGLGVDAQGLRVSDLKGQMFGGALSGLFELKNVDGSGLVSAQLEMKNADIDAVFPQASLVGKGDTSLVLSSSGKSLEALVAAASGSGTVAFRDMAITGVNPTAFPAFVAKADEIGRGIDARQTEGFAPEIASDGIYEAADGDAAFTLAGGIIRMPPMTLKNPSASISADIRADLNDGQVSADGSIAYQPGDEALVGSEPALRFSMSGPVSDLSRRFDSAPLAQFLTQRALEKEQARVEAMQSALLEKQRLRREARYYAALQDQRVRAAEEARLKAEAEAKARAEAEEAARKQEEAVRLAAQEKAKAEAERAQEEQAAPPANEENAPASAPQPGGFDANSIENLLKSL